MFNGALDAASNRETFQREFQITDMETGDAMTLTGGTVVFEIRWRDSSPSQSDGYGGLTSGAILTATNDDGVEFIDDDLTMQITFSESAMNTLCPGTYDVGMTFERDGITRQVIAGTLPVLDGKVS